MELQATLVIFALLFVDIMCHEVSEDKEQHNVPRSSAGDDIKRPDIRDTESLRYAAMRIENTMKDYGPLFSLFIEDLVQTKDDPWTKFMDRAAEEKDVFKYTLRTVEGKTEIESVNGLYAKPEDDLTWAVIFTEVIGDDCRVPQSVERFFPVDDDHILIKLMTKSEAKKIPVCFWPIKEEDTPPPL